MNTPLKKSKQRDALIAFLQSRQDHPSADLIYSSMRESFPNISLGTVYRNLALLCELGEITKLTVDDKADRYEARQDPHYHFICDSCNQVTDLELEALHDIDAIANNHFSGKITGHTTTFHGTCNKCLAKPKENKKEVDKDYQR